MILDNCFWIHLQILDEGTGWGVWVWGGWWVRWERGSFSSFVTILYVLLPYVFVEFSRVINLSHQSVPICVALTALLTVILSMSTTLRSHLLNCMVAKEVVKCTDWSVHLNGKLAVYQLILHYITSTLSPLIHTCRNFSFHFTSGAARPGRSFPWKPHWDTYKILLGIWKCP